MRLRVECYAGHRGDETPRALAIGARRIEIIEILDRWLAPDYRYFKLRGEDGDTYIVRHDAASDAWELTMFERSASASSSSSDVAASGESKRIERDGESITGRRSPPSSEE
jgi:hypothetical protein